MITVLPDLYAQASKWLNDNQGVISVTIFIVTVAFGWVSGIFASLRRRPKFQLSNLGGPTFGCRYSVDKRYSEHEAHRIGIALYLRIRNVGSAASSIENISIGYHWPGRSYSRVWIHNQCVALADFQFMFGENIKVYPFLTQVNNLLQERQETFLQVGQSTNGVVYFEQDDLLGSDFLAAKDDQICVQVVVKDAFGKQHATKLTIPSLSIEDARKYNPLFGKTLAEVRGESPSGQPNLMC